MSELTLEQLYDAIGATIRAQMPAIRFADAWPDVKRRITLPAVLLELDELEPGDDPGTGETALIGRFQARIIVDSRPEAGHRAASMLASQLAVLLRDQQWGLPIAVAQFLRACPDFMRPDLDSYTVWLVEWTHEFHLGQFTWPWEDSSGVTLYLGVDPDTGPGNEPLYWPAGDDPHPEA